MLAEIEAPELDQQILQAKAAVEQADAAVQQAAGQPRNRRRSNENLAHVTSDRFQKLADKGVISKQDNDTYQMQWAGPASQRAGARKSRQCRQEQRRRRSRPTWRDLNDLQGYLTVRAPFAGVITLRNIDDRRAGE